eukprot:Sspe_Gene.50629::Locus_28169_Transcript_1_1_Confidence_1.000_Length_1048::g.50629::m.50629
MALERDTVFEEAMSAGAGGQQERKTRKRWGKGGKGDASKTFKFTDASGVEHEVRLHFPPSKAKEIVRCCDPFNERVYEIPLSFVHKTVGSETFLANRSGRRAQICMKFQENKCNMKEKCQQVHADLGFVSALREKYLGSKKSYVTEIMCTDPSTTPPQTISIKYSDTEPTDGRDWYRLQENVDPASVAICVEFLKKKECPKGSNCRLIHVTQEKYAKARVLPKEGTATSPALSAIPVSAPPTARFTTLPWANSPAASSPTPPNSMVTMISVPVASPVALVQPMVSIPTLAVPVNVTGTPFMVSNTAILQTREAPVATPILAHDPTGAIALQAS